MNKPRITALMTVFNGEKYIREAIESFLNQTYKDFEFLIIDDASVDSSRDIILSFKDPRIRLIANEKNIGFVSSLNKGLQLAKGEYIARIDADDISMPERLEKQLIFMENHPEVGLLGCWVENIDEFGNIIDNWHRPHENGHLRWCLLTGTNCIAHSSTFYRKKIALQLGGYREMRAEDYDLWSRMSFQTKIYQIPEFLIRLRKHISSSVEKYSKETEKMTRLVMRESMSRILEKDITGEQIDIFRNAFLKYDFINVRPMFQLLFRLYEVYIKNVNLSENEKTQIKNDIVNVVAGTHIKYKHRYHIKIIFIIISQIISDKDILNMLILRSKKKLLNLLSRN